MGGLGQAEGDGGSGGRIVMNVVAEDNFYDTV